MLGLVLKRNMGPSAENFVYGARMNGAKGLNAYQDWQ